jgi:hypothetical protein
VRHSQDIVWTQRRTSSRIDLDFRGNGHANGWSRRCAKGRGGRVRALSGIKPGIPIQEAVSISVWIVPHVSVRAAVAYSDHRSLTYLSFGIGGWASARSP